MSVKYNRLVACTPNPASMHNSNERDSACLRQVATPTPEEEKPGISPDISDKTVDGGVVYTKTRGVCNAKVGSMGGEEVVGEVPW